VKDQLIAILEALRLSKAAISRHLEPNGPNADATVETIANILDDRSVLIAMAALYPNVESPCMAEAPRECDPALEGVSEFLPK
jgi:hypothetical protein